MAEKQAERLLEQLIPEVAIVNNPEVFQKTHGFTIKEYLHNRTLFTITCREHASHIEKVVRDTGIAKTTGGAVGIALGGAVIAGIFLAPFTAGASLALTVGEIAGGVASAGTSIVSQLVKDGNVKSDQEKIQAALKGVIGELFSSISETVKELRKLMADPSVLQMIKDIAQGIKTFGWNIAYQGVNLVRTVNAIKFAQCVAQFIQADFYAMSGIAQGMAAPGIGGARIFGRALIAAGSTTAKLLSGALGAVGIGFGIYDVVKGAQHINGSEIADEYRKFANDYEKETKNLSDGIEALKKMVSS